MIKRVKRRVKKERERERVISDSIDICEYLIGDVYKYTWMLQASVTIVLAYFCQMQKRHRCVSKYLFLPTYIALVWMLPNSHLCLSFQGLNYHATQTVYLLKKPCKIRHCTDLNEDNTRVKCYKTFYGRNLQMFVISQPVCLPVANLSSLDYCLQERPDLTSMALTWD
jgi:hypothetical protein